MANEQIVLTQHDFDIELKLNFIDYKKNPVDLKNCAIDIMFISPSGIKYPKQGNITNVKQGGVNYILPKELTSEDGLWVSYWSAVDLDQRVTAQEQIYYYVLPIYGGAGDGQ